jgi:hypothetical protein
LGNCPQAISSWSVRGRTRQDADQKRSNPDLAVQVGALQAFARERGLIIVFISQIDRRYDPSAKPYPDLNDVRLPILLISACLARRVFSARAKLGSGLGWHSKD